MAPSESRNEDTEVTFFINGEKHCLNQDVPLSTTLLEYLREIVNLRGTKACCMEGGCGVCTVVATTFDHERKTNKTLSIRSCQTLVHSCAGWIITTIEHLGNNKIGYDLLQVALKEFYGTQCGVCAPGFVMTMHELIQKSPELTVAEVEMAFDGNLCRCTGYRPILEAFKSFAKDAPARLKNKLVDIEDVYKQKCKQTGKECTGHCQNGCSTTAKQTLEPVQPIAMEHSGAKWFRPKTLKGVFDALKTKKSSDKVRLVVGNTGQGVFRNEGPFTMYIDTSGIKELYETQPTFSIGANVSLSRCIELFHHSAQQHKGFKHLEQIAKHWEFVANVGVRNIGCWAGNLMMKHNHPGFCSDIFTTLLAVEANLKIATLPFSTKEVSLEEFLSMDMTDCIILSLSIPPQPENVILRTFKISPRAVNAHAYVNAAFKFHIGDFKDNFRVVNMPAIIFSGINPNFTRARATEKFFVGKQLCDVETIQEAVKILGQEIDPDEMPQDASPEYRRSLSQCLLYKTILGILGKSSVPLVASGGPILQRLTSSSKQTYDENEETWPIGQAMPKLESETQISGEAEYIDDMPPHPNELYGCFVQTTVAKATIKNIDARECLNYPGVVDFITAKDIPGENTFMVTLVVSGMPDPIFVDKEVLYAGQSIGLVVAKSKSIAREATKLVKVTYENVVEPVLDARTSIARERSGIALDLVTQSFDPFKRGNVEDGFKKSKNILEGEFDQGSQFHFPMEPLIARVVPKDDGYDVYTSTQWVAEAQKVVSKLLLIPANSINIQVKRVGGAFGGKSTRSNLVLGACAVAANKLRKPVRVALTLTDHMTLVGWRNLYYTKYKVGFSNAGVLDAVEADTYADCGHVNNECSSFDAARFFSNTYHCPNWKVQAWFATTDTAANTWCRAPGITQGIAAMENIIERIADHLQIDPAIVRDRNLLTTDNLEMIYGRTDDSIVADKIFPLLKKSSSLDIRKLEVKNFNKNNRWKKRGIAIMPIHYGFGYSSFITFNCHVVIYEHDGTVAIQHGGIEMGQGLNTKVAQAAAKTLDIPMDLIRVKPSDTFAGGNSFISGGSTTSELCAYGIMVCCEKLRERMNVVAVKMKQDGEDASSWINLVKKCFMQSVDLSERYMTFGHRESKGYDGWASAVAEVEVDVLTGQYLIHRVDIMEDCGRSLSPYLDIGQIEGAFIMGLGLVTSEKVKFDPKTGQKLSNGTWEYKPPTALDIPEDFRITLMPKGDNPKGVARSKATGEPGVCLSYVIVAALREAIKSAREDSGVKGWFEMYPPMTVDVVHKLCNVKPSDFTV